VIAELFIKVIRLCLTCTKIRIERLMAISSLEVFFMSYEEGGSEGGLSWRPSRGRGAGAGERAGGRGKGGPGGGRCRVLGAGVNKREGRGVARR